ncbi:MAG: response regulator transcription factor [Burkholderiales bacterium]
MRLVVAEDDQLLGSAVQTILVRAGYAVDWVQTGREFESAIATHRYDCAVLDLGLPDTTGETLLKQLRARREQLPVIVVTARGGVQDRVTLLDHGADDYLVKPFDLDELSARIRSVMRRAPNGDGTAEALIHGALRLFPQRYSASWYDQEVVLTHREYWVLEALVRRKAQVLTRAQLEEALYGWGEEIGSNTVEVYIHFLRRKLHPGLIQTVRGLGYQLAPVVRDA